MKNRVFRIGVELEGGWNPVPPGSNLVHDGSVRLEDPIGRYARGEIPSPPLGMEEWEPWVRAHYPQACNATCGLHTHLSFRSARQYQWLMDPAYPKAIIAAVQKWSKGLPPKHYIWERLRGKNRYCLDQFLADQQARVAQKGHSRYTAVNYCYLLHRTLEVRLLPMFEDIAPTVEKVIPPEWLVKGKACPPGEAQLREVAPGRKGVDLAVEAIKVILATTNEFLLASARRERPLTASLALDQSATVAETFRLTI